MVEGVDIVDSILHAYRWCEYGNEAIVPILPINLFKCEEVISLDYIGWMCNIYSCTSPFGNT